MTSSPWRRPPPTCTYWQYTWLYSEDVGPHVTVTGNGGLTEHIDPARQAPGGADGGLTQPVRAGRRHHAQQDQTLPASVAFGLVDQVEHRNALLDAFIASR